MRQLIFDTETTGLNPSSERLVSLAAVEVIDGNLTGSFAHWHLNPGKPSQPKALEVHGLTEEYLATQPKLINVVDRMIRFIDGCPLIIHNANFDLGFLDIELARARAEAAGNPTAAHWVYQGESRCTYRKAVSVRGTAKGRNTLDTLAREWGVQNLRELTGKHGALVDCLVLYGVFRVLANLPAKPLLQSELDHYLSKGFGVHGNFESAGTGGARLPSPAQSHPAGVSSDVRPVG